MSRLAVYTGSACRIAHRELSRHRYVRMNEPRFVTRYAFTRHRYVRTSRVFATIPVCTVSLPSST